MQGSTTISSTSLVACYHSTEQKLVTAQQQTVGKTDLDQKLDKRYSDDATKTEHRKMHKNPKPGTQNMTQNNL